MHLHTHTHNHANTQTQKEILLCKFVNVVAGEDENCILGLRLTPRKYNRQDVCITYYVALKVL